MPVSKMCYAQDDFIHEVLNDLVYQPLVAPLASGSDDLNIPYLISCYQLW
jgi:hypothetical protein